MVPLKVNPEYLVLVPRPMAEEYQTLETDIIATGGATEPIIVNEAGVILDGHTRYEICAKHGLTYRTDIRKFDSELDEKIYVITVNLKRRHMTDMQKILMAEPLEALLSEKAKQRMSEGGKGTSFEAPLIVTKEAANQIGVSKATYERGRKIRNEGTPEEIQKACSRPRQVNKVYLEIQRRHVLEKALSMPEQTEKIKYNTYQMKEKGGVYLGIGSGVYWLTNYIIEKDDANNLSLIIRLANNPNYSQEERAKHALIWNALYHLTDEGLDKIIERTTPGPAKERVGYIVYWLKWLRQENQLDAMKKQLIELTIKELYEKYRQITVEFTDGQKKQLELEKFPVGTFFMSSKDRGYKKGGGKWMELVLKQYILPQIAEQLVEDRLSEPDDTEEAT